MVLVNSNAHSFKKQVVSNSPSAFEWLLLQLNDTGLKQSLWNQSLKQQLFARGLRKKLAQLNIVVFTQHRRDYSKIILYKSQTDQWDLGWVLDLNMLLTLRSQHSMISKTRQNDPNSCVKLLSQTCWCWCYLICRLLQPQTPGAEETNWPLQKESGIGRVQM